MCRRSISVVMARLAFATYIYTASGAYEPPKAARSVQLRIIAQKGICVARSFYHKRISEISYQLHHPGCVH